ncbi:Kinesin-like protein KIF26B [Camelus dromedarius]|uniref:Kinesin-like protein KIF26B n=1 Tax=Camelus dromedarius TaxID=9838 RepID=A0A5N4CIG3_CAMDR|nr:Kinesin-like protein KIF26B [Camelus dromedarius]
MGGFSMNSLPFLRIVFLKPGEAFSRILNLGSCWDGCRVQKRGELNLWAPLKKPLETPERVNEVCSPTKPAAPFSPESWYRKAYEESRAGNRPTPEGAGSALGSSGTPSPGSGTSSPSSFTGSPGPASPGIGTSSPGSLGGSPGFGTGSPGSGSGGGSSPGSDRGVWCENCNARLVELKRQALKLLLPGPFPGKVSAAAAGGWGTRGAASSSARQGARPGRVSPGPWGRPRALPPPGSPWALDSASMVPGLAVHWDGHRLFVLPSSTP